MALEQPRWSVLAALARIFGEKDIKSESFELSYNLYRFTEPFRGSHEAGNEFDLRLKLEAPTGVAWTVGMGCFSPGSALRYAFANKPRVWSVRANLNVTVR